MHIHRPISPALEGALRQAARWHAGQTRKSSDVPYIAHPMAVAWVLDRLAFDESVLIAALLHDVIEDCGATREQVSAVVGDTAAAYVAACSERKLDAAGNKRPWHDRKAEHLQQLGAAPPAVRAIVLCDKWHNLFATCLDLEAGATVWERFNADRDDWLAMNRRFVDTLAAADPRDERVEYLAELCRRELERLEASESAMSGEDVH
jgi:(p)ppGpp synthase/HD superfamily hydrolase